MSFDCGLDIAAMANPMGFVFGAGVFGPEPEIRRLDDIRASLADPDSSGPEELYCICMDVGKESDRADLIGRNLLYGVVTYAAGRIGEEPIRSQGHIHAVSASCGASTCEVYEIWDGSAVIYMQRSGGDNPGDCYAIKASAGDVVIVPPGWVHATINADPERAMTFGAWCVRDYGFDYRAVRSHGGIAYFPKLRENKLVWTANQAYHGGTLTIKPARAYPEFGLEAGQSIYSQYEKNHALFEFVTNPEKYKTLWENYGA